MKCVILLFVLFFGLNVFAQKDSSRWDLNKYVWSHAQNTKPYLVYGNESNNIKPSIDTQTLEKWPYVKNPCISNDGAYVAYSIINKPVGAETLVIQSTDNSWKKEIVNGHSYAFIKYYDVFVYMVSDTLWFFQLKKNTSSFFTNVINYKLPLSGNKEWIAYQFKDSTKRLVLKNLIDGSEQYFNYIVDFVFNQKGNALLLKAQSMQSNVITDTLRWIDLKSRTSRTIGFTDSGARINYYKFDSSGSQIVFNVTDKKDNQLLNTIWYYNDKMDNAKMLVDNGAFSSEPDLCISNFTLEFSRNGKWVFFKLQKRAKDVPKPDAVKVDVWSYKDVILQPVQSLRTYLTAINVNNQKLIQIEKEDLNAYIDANGKFWNYNNYLIVYDKGRSVQWWNSPMERSYYLYSLEDGSRKFLKKGMTYEFSISPKGKYIVYFDSKKEHYFSYNIEKAEAYNISQAITTILRNEKFDDMPSRKSGEKNGFPAGVGIGGWLKDDSALFVYDNYDIWQIYTTGKKMPLNVTNGYGQLHKIKFRLLYEKDIFENLEKEPLLLTAFDIINKNNGIFKKVVGRKGEPEKLSMGPYTLFVTESQLPNYNFRITRTILPLKAQDANIWVIERMKATESPNYYLTKDFKQFTALSNVHPENNNNWLTAELVSWKQLDGKISQGILYKPENFDPRKKYPLIIHYYEKLSDRLNEFFQPKYTKDNINIPWFVSQGYLVFTPDIYYTIGKIGSSTYNTVVSAARYLSNRPYVNAKKIGIQGHSFGGFETNYLITRTNMFAAASEAAGTCDHIREYGTMVDGTPDKQDVLEVGHRRIGGTLWERQSEFFDNSPILNANKISTPLLIMHNKGDRAISWDQGVAFFLALRRLDKKAWMLQYDNGTHSVFGNDAIDFTIRLTQFFNHYLKDEPAPRWMTEGIPADMKGIKSGYEIDPLGSCGKDCIICNKSK